jgi:hypothetical protein
MEFVTFEIAKKLKEKGFRDKCYKHYYPDSPDWFLSSYLECNNYSDYVDAPTISQALKWLREEKKMHIEIFLYCRKYGYLVNYTQIYEDDLFHKCLNEDTADGEYATYEQAVLAGIEYVLDNLI